MTDHIWDGSDKLNWAKPRTFTVSYEIPPGAKYLEDPNVARLVMRELVKMGIQGMATKDQLIEAMILAGVWAGEHP